MTTAHAEPVDLDGPRRLVALERLLAIPATTVSAALQAATDVIAAAVGADKVDAFLYEAATHTLVAVGTSATAMGHLQRRLGLHRLPIANGGRVVEVFETGQPWQHGAVDTDTEDLRGIRDALGVRSQVTLPLEVGGVRRGVLAAASAQREAFSVADRHFLDAVAHWVSLVLQRAELVEHRTQEAQAETRRLVAEELVTVLAHDLGNYLTPLVGHAYLLRRRAEQAGRTADVETTELLQRGLQRLGQLTTELLDVGRLEQGLFAVVGRPLDLVALVEATVASVRTAEFAVEVAAPVELVAEVDGPRIRQALENLLANARHHAAGSPVVVEVEQCTRDDTAWALLRVVDRGPGIPAPLRGQLVERFARGTTSLGLGVGLYLVRGIAEAHGGTVTLGATPGGGTTVELALPLHAPRHQSQRPYGTGGAGDCAGDRPVAGSVGGRTGS